MQDPGMKGASNPFQQSTSQQGRPQPGSSNGTQSGGARQNDTSSGKPADSPKNTMGEYIDFEEIK